jgi:hypothetical protein
MRTYEFKLILADVQEVSDVQADALYRAGCDDGTIVSRDREAFIQFSREANSLEDAINSAASDIARAGLRAARVEAECPV